MIFMTHGPESKLWFSPSSCWYMYTLSHFKNAPLINSRCLREKLFLFNFETTDKESIHLCVTHAKWFRWTTHKSVIWRKSEVPTKHEFMKPSKSEPFCCYDNTVWSHTISAMVWNAYHAPPWYEMHTVLILKVKDTHFLKQISFLKSINFLFVMFWIQPQ